ncbi:hypothetical protein TL16_g08005, partial [Triparma laevis f. inornata]
TVEGWLVAKVLELLGAGVEGAGGRIPYWASHGLFGGRDLKWERGEEKLVEYQEDWIDWRMGREERGVGGRRDVLALNAGGWAPERGMMELCGVGELRVPNLVVNVRRPLVDVVLWREWVGGGEGGGVWDDVKFLRSVIGIFKKWRAVGEKGGGFGGDGFEVLEIEMGGTAGLAELVEDIADTMAASLKKRRGDAKKWEKGIVKVVEVVEKVEGDFEAWKAKFVAENEEWPKRKERILKTFKSFILRETQ